MPKKPIVEGGGAGVAPHADPGAWADQYPHLAGYLTDPTWPDGAVRAASRLFIEPRAGTWQAVLKEPAQGVQLVVTADRPELLLPALEAMLSSPSPLWVVDPWAKPQGKKRRG